MAETRLHVRVRTPHAVVAKLAVASLRVPSDTGQVGLRPRSEACVIALEPGLVLAHAAEGARFLATAGGLLRYDGHEAVALSPIAVLGDDAASAQARLDAALATPAADAELGRAIERLERGLLLELRQPVSEGRSAASGRAT